MLYQDRLQAPFSEGVLAFTPALSFGFRFYKHDLIPPGKRRIKREHYVTRSCAKNFNKFASRQSKICVLVCVVAVSVGNSLLNEK